MLDLISPGSDEPNTGASHIFGMPFLLACGLSELGVLASGSCLQSEPFLEKEPIFQYHCSNSREDSSFREGKQYEHQTG
jgi:hypothetical protein